MRSFLISGAACLCLLISNLSVHLATATDLQIGNLGVGQESPDGVWQFIDDKLVPVVPETQVMLARPHSSSRLSLESLNALLEVAPMEFSDDARKREVLVSVPMPDGTFGRFRIEQSPIMEPGLADRFPEVKTYRGQGIDDPTATARFDWMPLGFHAIVLSAQGTSFVEPFSEDDTTNYISYFNHDVLTDKLSLSCLLSKSDLADAERRGIALIQPEPAFATGATLRTYRLAVAATGEFTQQYGGGNVSTTIMKITTLVNQVTAVYQKEAAISFQLVANESLIVFTDPTLDPYPNDTSDMMLNQNQATLDALIGPTNYDIGHVFGGISVGPNSVSFSGRASIGVVCSLLNKAKGVSTMGGAVSNFPHSIFVSGVTHEIGHQFSARHTFNSTTNGCSGNRDATAAYEPGSGSTIMAYSICGSDNLQNLDDLYFHTGSLESIVGYAAGSGNCAATTTTGNGAPSISALSNFTIPANTPFTLNGSVTDPNGDAMTFTWEEFDLGNASPPNTDDGTRPILRSLAPSASSSRTFPRLQYILNNANVPPSSYTCGSGTCLTGEVLPSTTRTMNFRLTARDNRASGGGTANAGMLLNVISTAGPFAVTQPNTAVSWPGGSAQTVTWSVANTSNSPVSCANVKISLSTDGGNTYPTVLAPSTPNDGSQTVPIPNISTTTARIKVEATDNVFFDVSNSNFTITISSTAFYQGFHDGAGCNTIQGWAWDANNPSSTVSVDIYDGNALIGTVPANMYREDLLNSLGSPNHGFSLNTPASLRNGAAHTIFVKFAGTNTLLSNTGRVIQCSQASSYYGRHDGQGCNAIEGWAWDGNDPNGTVNVDIYEGSTLITTIAATLYRQDLVSLGNPYHGWIFHTPPSLRDGQPHTITVKFGGTNINLPLDTPRTTSCTSSTPNLQGNLDSADCNFISGYAWDANDDQGTVVVAIYVDGAVFVVVAAQDAYPGVGTGYHGFKFAVPASLKNGQPHSIMVRFSGTTTSLMNSPRNINCSP